MSRRLFYLSMICLHFRCSQGLEECARPELIYDALIVYGMELVYEGHLFEAAIVNMASDVNTLERRRDAYGFFNETYGIVFDESIEGLQTDSTGVFMMNPHEVRQEVGWRIFSFDAQRPALWGLTGRNPVSNSHFRDVSYMAYPDVDVTTPNGHFVQAGEFLSWGHLMLYIDSQYSGVEFQIQMPDGAVGEPLPVPTAQNPHVGSVTPCLVNSEEFGTGMATFNCLFSYVNDAQTRAFCSSMMKFPRALEDTNSAGRRLCNDLRMPEIPRQRYVSDGFENNGSGTLQDPVQGTKEIEFSNN